MKVDVVTDFKRPVFWVARVVFQCAVFFASLVPAGLRAESPAKAQSYPAVVEGRDGWLFLGAELRFLGVENFWGSSQSKGKGTTLNQGSGAPLPAIVDFDRQLKALGVRLIVLPVPPKAWWSKHAPQGGRAGVKSDSLGGFYRELGAQGVEVLDLRPVFTTREAAGESMYCKTDSHWSGRGCVVAAQAVAERLDSLRQVASPALKERWKDCSIKGDLGEMLPGKAKKLGDEQVSMREISDDQGNGVANNAESPLLLLGDSHTLVFREFQGERSGLADQLAFETGTVPDVIGTRGSGANAVRVSLFRRNLKDSRYLSSKKVLVWCFAAREFTETDQGWQVIPLSRSEEQAK
jgi:hypothetical protein